MCKPAVYIIVQVIQPLDTKIFLMKRNSIALILSQKQNYNLLGDNLLPFIKHGFLRSEENVNLNNFPTLDGVWVLMCPVIFWIQLCKLTNTKADVVLLCCIGRFCAFGRWYCHLIVRQMVSHRGRCYNLFTEQSGRCYCHCNNMWQMVSHTGAS